MRITLKRRILPLLLSAALCLSFVPLSALAEPEVPSTSEDSVPPEATPEPEAGKYTITLKTDSADNMSGIGIYIGGAESPEATERILNEPIQISSTASNMSLMFAYPASLRAYAVSVGGVTCAFAVDDVASPDRYIGSPADAFFGSDLLEKVSAKIGGNLGELINVDSYLNILFNNSNSDFDGKNIDVEFIFGINTSSFTASVVQPENGTAAATDLGSDWWNLHTEPSRAFYDFDCWEYSVNEGETWSKAETTEGKLAVTVKLAENRQYRPVFTLKEIALGQIDPRHAEIIAGLADGGAAELTVGEAGENQHKYAIIRDGNDIAFTRYEGPGGEISIPVGITVIRGPSTSSTRADTANPTITGAVIPEGVTKIDNYAFRYCSKLVSVSLPSTLATIGNYAFDHTGLTKVAFPEFLDSVGNYAFQYTKIQSIEVPLLMANGKLGSYIFAYCDELAEVIIPTDTTMASLPAFFLYNCPKITHFTIPESVTQIGSHVFVGTQITEIIIPRNVTRLTDSFREMSVLRTVTFLGPVATIGRLTFVKCEALTEFKFPALANITDINSGTPTFFGSCKSLETLILPEVIDTLGSNYLQTCSSLKTLVVPEITGALNTNVFGTATSSAAKNIMNQLTIYTRPGSRVTDIVAAKTSWQPIKIEYLGATAQISAQNGNELVYADASRFIDWNLAELYRYAPRAVELQAWDVTALDALFAAHKAKYGDDVLKHLTVDENGTVAKAFGVATNGTFGFTLNGEVPQTGLSETVITDEDTIHFYFGGVSSHNSFSYDNAPVYQIAMQPKTGYVLKIVASGASVYAALNPIGGELEIELIGTTNANGEVTLNFAQPGKHIVYALVPDGVFAALRVVVQGVDARLGGISATGDVPFETLTPLMSGYNAGTLVKTDGDGTPVESGFAPDHLTYNYYVNANISRLDFNIAPKNPIYSRGMTLAVTVGDESLTSFTAATTDKWYAVLVTLNEGSTSTTLVTFAVTYTEDGQSETKTYTVHIIKCEMLPHTWLLDLSAPIYGRTHLVGEFDYTRAPGGKSLIVYKDDEFAVATVKISAGNKLYIGNVEQKSTAVNQRHGAWLVDEYTLELAIPQDLTGKNPNDLSVETYAVTVVSGERNETQDVRIEVRSHYDGILTPDRVIEFVSAPGQYAHAPVRENGNIVLESDTHYIGTTLGLGGLGGYLVVEYDEPIENNPNNPYGIDFIIYGNAFESGAAREPGSVQVSQNGKDWYYLAGSNHYELNVVFDKDARLQNGETVKTMAFLKEAGYPNVTFGYADVMGCSEVINADKIWAVKGELYNPYTIDYKGVIGDGMDISWAVDEYGSPVEIDSVKYIRIQSATDLKENGSFGEVSTEICTIIKIRPQDQLVPIGVTAEPKTITVGGKTLDELKLMPIEDHSFNDGQITYYELDLKDIDDSAGYVPITVKGATAKDNIYVNAQRGVGEVSYNALFDDSGNRTVRILTQNEDNAARIYVLKMTGGDATATAKNTEIASVSLIPGDVSLTKDAVGNYIGTVANTAQNVKLAVSTLNPEAAIELGDAPLEDGEMSGALPVAVGANKFMVSVTSADGSETAEYTVVITREASSGTPGAPSNTITVWFEFTGDDIHYDFNGGDKYADASYTKLGDHNPKTWINRRQVTVPVGSTVKYVTDMLLMNSGIEFSSRDMGTYIDWVKIPANSGNNPVGGKLEEFSNGPGSGWMFRYDGYIANEGYATRELKNGTQILWFYTDDYTLEDKYESGNWGFNTSPNGNASDGGDDTTTITDEPTALAESGGGNIVATETVTAETKTADGKATAAIDTQAVTEAVAKAQEAVNASTAANAKAEIKIVAKTSDTTEPISSSEVNIPAEAIKAVAAAQDLILTIESDVSTISLDTATLAAIAADAKDGDTVTIAAEVGEDSVIDLTISTGSAPMTDLGGTVTVSLPYTPDATTAPEDYDLLTVYHLADDGKTTEIKGARYDAAAKQMIFATTHFSKFLISEWISPFNDIAKGDWYYRAARYAYSNALITGTTDTTFAPQSTLTRAMLATILYRNAAGDAALGVPRAETPFTDVVSGQWYTDAIAWASSNGIVNGVGDDKFAPNAPITREQFATLLYRYAQWSDTTASGTANLSAYTDADAVSEYARDAMAWAVANGLITGRTATTLAPQGTATRAEAATLLQRYLENVG